ncbi:MAG: hypothetical protein ACYC2H_02055 [Thermoplasmatota archaeon]
MDPGNPRPAPKTSARTVFNGPVTGVQIGDTNAQANHVAIIIGPDLQRLQKLVVESELAPADRQDCHDAIERVRKAA